MVLDMVFDHEGIVNLRLSSSASGSVAGICLIPASALSFSRFILLESGFPVGSLCHLSSCRSWEYPMRSIDPLSKSLFSPLISSMGRRESSMIFSWDTRSFPFNLFCDLRAFPFQVIDRTGINIIFCHGGKTKIKFIAYDGGNIRLTDIFL